MCTIERQRIVILNNNGREVKCETVRGHWPKLLERLAMIKGAWTICFEATCGYGYCIANCHGWPVASPWRIPVDYG